MSELEQTLRDAVSPPLSAEEVTPPDLPYDAQLDPEQLAMYQKEHARHTFWARVALLSVIFGMLAANMWLTQRNLEVMMVNMDDARHGQSVIIDQQEAIVAEQGKRLDAIDARLDALETRSTATVSVASTPQ